MFDTDPFAKRGKAMEDEFFHQVDKKLHEQLRASMERDASHKAIVDATGIEDPALVNELLDAGIDAATMIALAHIPGIFVAWADGSVTDAERLEVLKAATEKGIVEDHVARGLLEGWLKSRPPKSLWETWQHYAAATVKSLPQPVVAELADEIVKHATWVAKASGGVLGLGKISEAEQKVIDRTREAFQ